jgi:uncharacterized protein HemY
VWLALVVFVVRLVAIISGSWSGCQMGGVKSELQRRCFWMSMVTQASGCLGAGDVSMRGVWGVCTCCQLQHKPAAMTN